MKGAETSESGVHHRSVGGVGIVHLLDVEQGRYIVEKEQAEVGEGEEGCPPGVGGPRS